MKTKFSFVAKVGGMMKVFFQDLKVSVFQHYLTFTGFWDFFPKAQSEE